MSTLHGITNNQIYPQPGFSAARDENGGWRGSAEFVVTAATWAQASWRAQFANGTPITNLDPSLDPYFSFLTVQSQTVTRNEGGLVTVMVEVTGSSGAQYDNGDLGGDALPTYRLEGRLQEAPLSQHPKWKTLSDNDKYALGELIDGRARPNYNWTQVGDYELVEGFSWALTFAPLRDSSDNPITLSSDAVQFAKIIAAGVTTYLVPTITYTESTQGTDPMTAAQLNLLGKISTPRGNPPTPSGSRNWMLTGASQEQRGELYQTQIEWTLSDREGWNSFLYS